MSAVGFVNKVQVSSWTLCNFYLCFVICQPLVVILNSVVIMYCFLLSLICLASCFQQTNVTENGVQLKHTENVLQLNAKLYNIRCEFDSFLIATINICLFLNYEKKNSLSGNDFCLKNPCIRQSAISLREMKIRETYYNYVRLCSSNCTD